jgi:hypothetical protein
VTIDAEKGSTNPDPRTPGGEHPPDFVLELIHADEGASRVSEAWRRHSAGCCRCTARLAELDRDSRAYQASARARSLRQLLATTMTAAAEAAAGRGAPSSRRFSRSPWWLGLSAAAAGIALVAALAVRTPDAGGDLHIKGRGRLGAEVRREGRTAPWDGGPLRAGDQLQPTWAGPTAGFLVVTAREGAREEIELFPDDKDGAGSVPAGAVRAVGGSLTITPAPSPFTVTVTACFATTARPTPVPTNALAGAAPGLGGRGRGDACTGEIQRLDLKVSSP